MERSLLCLLLVLAVGFALKQKREPLEWDYRSEAEKVNMRGCANLTNVLDNWKFAIMTQFQNLLLYDHHTVLPDYGRIKSLSEALDDLYKEFNAVKERLGELSTKFESVETFVDQVNAGRQIQPAKSSPDAERSHIVPTLQLSPGILGGHRGQTQPARSSPDAERSGNTPTLQLSSGVLGNHRGQTQPARSSPDAERSGNTPTLQLSPGILGNHRGQTQPARSSPDAERSSMVPTLQLLPGILTNSGTETRRTKKP